ncbi:MAG: tyrosine-type recombinase/integrase, partial [Synergistaceae bacterium]|nr:tyrosine-type recombinase/integrase [Synergistaceae bacterium]
YLFYTTRKGVRSQMSSDAAQAFIKKYGDMARTSVAEIPHLHPHLFRHTRAMHLYMAGMPLELVSQWLGHSQMETSLIYARATTEMKRKAIDKISTAENSVFKRDEKFKYADNEMVIRQLYGLM